MIVVEGTVRISDFEKARPHMKTMIQASREESGCIDYSYAVDLTDPSIIRVVERWTDRAALDQHLETEHTAAWRASWSKIGITDRSLRMYEAEPEMF